MPKQRFVILGGGISGLSLGWFLKRRYGNDIALTILEKDVRPGGWIRTLEYDGFLFEKGPRSCRSTGTGVATLQLAEELGLAGETIAASPSAVKRFLYTEGRLQQLPQGVTSFLLSPLMRGVLPALWREWRTPPESSSDESIFDFICRRLSSNIAERLIDPLTSGIYAGDIRKLSIQACFPEMFRWEQEHGSLLKGMLSKRKADKQTTSLFVSKMQRTPIFTFKGGMEILVKALATHLDDSIRLGCSVRTLELNGDGTNIILENGDMLQADHLFCALPSTEASALLNPLLAAENVQIATVPAVTVAVVNMGWKGNILKHNGFGYLIPTQEQEKVLGMVWDSSAFPQQNRSDTETRLTAMLGGAHHPEIEVLSRKEIVDRALLAVSHHLNINSPPDAIHTQVAKNAIPQYLVGHNDNVKRNEQNLKRLSSRLTLLGSSWHGVSVNDCIAESKRIALQTKKLYR